MFQIFKDPKIDFMGKRRIWVGISLTAVVLSLAILVVKGINFGIEFTGGTEIQVKYVATPDLGSIRSALTSAGLGNHLITTIGDLSDNEVYIRLGIQKKGTEDDLTRKILETLHAASAVPDTAGKLDLNTADAASFKTLLETSPDVAREDAGLLADSIVRQRKEAAILKSVDALNGIPKMSPAALDLLRSKTFAGPFAIRSQSYIGPTIGSELLRKAAWAILGSLGGMLAYIGFRFQVRWGVAAVLALVHDTVITLGLFSLFGKEMSLPVVAAFLTLIGYSVNDTVVIFDRIRENLKLKGAADLAAVINTSINQTLGRTILTSGLTWMVVLSLFVFAGESLNAFAFVLTFGIVVGTYSSVYIASPILVSWQQFLDRRKAASATLAPAAGGPGKAGPKKAKKVRSTSSVG